MQALNALNGASNSLAALQLFHDSIEGHVCSLESLGTPRDQYESMLVPVILKKIPPETRKTCQRTQHHTVDTN